MNKNNLRNYTTMRYVNLCLFLVLLAGFAVLGIYFGFLFTPYIIVGHGPIEDIPTMSVALSTMLGAIGISGALVSGFGLYYSIMSILKNDDSYVIKGFASYIAIGYIISIALLLNAVWLYRLTTSNYEYNELAFVIVIYLIALIVALIASNVPLVKLYGEETTPNSTMKVVVGALAAVDLGIALPFFASYLTSLSAGAFVNSTIVTAKFGSYALATFIAFLIFAFAFYLFSRGEKANKESKAGMGLFTGGTIVNGGAVLLAGIFAQVFEDKKGVSFLSNDQAPIDTYLEFSVISYILAGIIILGAIGLVIYSLVPHKKKTIQTY